MGYLSSGDLATVSTLSGVPVTHPAWNAGVAAAEGLITRFTGCKFGSSASEVLRVTLASRAMFITLPRDVTAFTSATFQGKTLEAAFGTGAVVYLSGAGTLELAGVDDVPIIWGAGAYRVTVTRGFSPVPGAVVKAASLLVAWFTDLSDPERSRFENLGMGDFSGTMRLTDFPVPEARGLLDSYRTAVRGSM